MDKVVKQESPIIRVTRWSVKIYLLKQGSKESKKDCDTTINGVDAEEKERVLYSRTI